MPTPGDIICGDVRLESLAPASLGAEVFQPVFVARQGDAGEAIWLTVVDGKFTPTSMNMSTFMAGANGMLGLRHPALVRVVLVDREMDYSVVGYEALPGAESMTDVITSGSSRKLLRRTAIEIARGLAFLHRREMLHGALTPSTVVLWEGMPVLWEHGIAALCAPSEFGPRARSLGGDVAAPEVIKGTQLTPAADVFAWGAVLAAVATGALGGEAVATILDEDIDEGRQAPLFALIRESLSPESAGRPRDGTHLLERLLSLEEEGQAAEPKTGDDADLSDLARRYLQEMSQVEQRPARASASTGVPEPVDDSESSGALGRVQLKKAKFSTDSQKLVSFIEEIDKRSPSQNDDRTPPPMPAVPGAPEVGLPKPPLAVPPARGKALGSGTRPRAPTIGSVLGGSKPGKPKPPVAPPLEPGAVPPMVPPSAPPLRPPTARSAAAASPPVAAPPKPAAPRTGPKFPSGEDSSSVAVPLWKAASASKPRRVDAAPRASAPATSVVADTPEPPRDAAPPPAAAPIVPARGQTGAQTGAIVDDPAPPQAQPEQGPPVADLDDDLAEADLRDAFLDLTQAVDDQLASRPPEPSHPMLASVPDDPTVPMDAGPEPQPVAVDRDITPVPTRPPDPDAPPRTGGWMRAADRDEVVDPKAAVDTDLPPAQDYGDGIHKRTFSPAAPTKSVDDPTPRDAIAVATDQAGKGTSTKAATKETSGLAKLRRLWPRRKSEDDVETAPPDAVLVPLPGDDPQDSVADASGKHDAIARDVLADLQRSPDESGRPSGDAAAADVSSELPAAREPPADRAPAEPPGLVRAKPVAPFVPPRAPGPHGPPGSIAAALIVLSVGAIAFAATLGAAEQRGGIDTLFAGAASAPTDAATPGAPAASSGPQCPAGSVALPTDTPVDDTTSIVCVDVAEFPGLQEVPLTGIDFAEAERRCEGRGRRLCTQAEWTLACRGLEGRKFPYGTKRQAKRCAASSKGELSPAGSHAQCVSPEGAYDLLGNAAEWVAEGVVLGGSVTTRSATCTTKLRPGKKARRAGIGARCCVDVVP